MGLGATTIFTGLLMIAICIGCGLLVRFSFMAVLSNGVEKWLSKYIPGYDIYKTMAEKRLQNKVKILPYASALIKHQEYWQPAYIVEQDHDGNYVVFLPDIPETSKGHVLLGKQDNLRIVSSVTANQLDASVKKMGKGLLTDYRIHKCDDG